MRRVHLNCSLLLLAALSGAVCAPPTSLKPNAAFDATKLPPPANADVDFARDIRPLFEARCWKCHGETKHESGLSLHRREAALAGGDSGKEFEPGKSAESRLIRYVSGLDSDTVMPPEGEGERLTAEQVGLLRAWIDQGAKWPAEADVAASPPARIGPTRSPSGRRFRRSRTPLGRETRSTPLCSPVSKGGPHAAARGRSRAADSPRVA